MWLNIVHKANQVNKRVAGGAHFDEDFGIINCEYCSYKSPSTSFGSRLLFHILYINLMSS